MTPQAVTRGRHAATASVRTADAEANRIRRMSEFVLRNQSSLPAGLRRAVRPPPDAPPLRRGAEPGPRFPASRADDGPPGRADAPLRPDGRLGATTSSTRRAERMNEDDSGSTPRGALRTVSRSKRSSNERRLPVPGLPDVRCVPADLGAADFA